MSEVLLPPWIIPEEESHEWLDEGSSVFAAAFAPGLAQRQSYGGLRLKLSRRHTVRGEEKAQLLSILKSTRGRFNAMRTKVHFPVRGAGFGTELLTNNTFASGTTGWTTDTEYSISVVDRLLRARRTAVDNTQFPLQPSVSAGTVQYAPYVARAFVANATPNFTSLGAYVTDGTQVSSSAGEAAALRTAPLLSIGTTLSTRVTDDQASGLLAGDYLDVSYISLALCAMVDNPGNALLRSDEFDNASWTKARATVSANSTTAPDGTTTADSLVEDATVTNTHEVTQSVTISSAIQHLCLTVALKANTRTWAQILMTEATGSTSVACYFNLATGAAGTTSTGANWSNLRTFATDMGNGWWQFAIVARKTNAATTVTCGIRLATGDGGAVYSGNGTSSIFAWRATLKVSALPVQLVQSTSASVASAAQTGAGLYLKGLPASTNGLLLPDDWIDVGGELKQVKAALNANASGLGFLRFEPPIVRSPADSDPIIVTEPMGKFLVSNIKVDNEFGLQARVSYDLEHIYE